MSASLASPFAARFARAYPRIDRLYRSHPRDGVLIVALDDRGTLLADRHVAIDAAATFTTIGRHPRCDLPVPGEEGLGQRHVVLSARRTGLADLCLRVWDLDTDRGVALESGESCTGLAAVGALFFAIGRAAIYCLPTGSLAEVPWGASAEETWASLPERVIDDRRRDRTPSARAGSPHDTLIVRGPARLRTRPRHWQPLEPAGRLHLRGAGESLELAIGRDELEDGVLIGRGAPCGVLADDAGVSRVHVLLVRDGDASWAIDTSSSNGTTARGVSVRCAPLDAATELVLAGRFRLSWEPATIDVEAPR